MNFKNKTAIVTGSTMGIGRSIARHLAQAGANVVLNGRNKARLEYTLSQFANEGLIVSACSGDVSSTEACRKLIEHTVENFGGVDILVNNAGIGSRGFFEDTQPDVFRQLINTNILGSIFPTLEALPYLKASRGSIVFISSLAAFRGMPNKCPYSMTKMAQTSVAESLRSELKNEGVHVGIIYVGITKNDPHKAVVQSDGSWQELKEREGVFVCSQDEVAKTVLNNIKSRHFKSIVGTQGKTYHFLQKYLPWFVDYTYSHSLDFIKEHDV